MKFGAKKLVADILWYSGITALTRKSSDKLTVLMYHKVKKDLFEEQIVYLKKHYTIVSEEEVIDFYYKKKKLLKNSVLITFDDGYLNNYEEAYPVLKKYSVPALIFLTTGFIGKKLFSWYDLAEYIISKGLGHFSFENNVFVLPHDKNDLSKDFFKIAKKLPIKARDELIETIRSNLEVKKPSHIPKEYQFMNWKQVKSMMPLVSFGAHSVHHPVLTTLKFSEIKKEILGSFNDLDSPKSFCFPNGNFNSLTEKVLKKSKFKLAFTVRNGVNSSDEDPYLIKRIGISEKDGKKVLAMKLSWLWGLKK